MLLHRSTVDACIKALEAYSESLKGVERDHIIGLICELEGEASNMGHISYDPTYPDFVETKWGYEVSLDTVGPNVVQVMKLIRETVGLELQKLQAMIRSVPAILLSEMSKEDAECIKQKFEAVGATVSFK